MPILLVLAVAGALAGKRVAPAGLGTMRTDTPTFVVLLIGVVVLIGALTFFPALLLGPVVQGLTDQPVLNARARTSSAPCSRSWSSRWCSASPTRCVMTGVAQVAFPGKADGSQIERDGKVVGSRLIGQDFVLDTTASKDADGNPVHAPDPRYFQPRPSATGYSPAATSSPTAGPTSTAARDFFTRQLARLPRARAAATTPG